MTGADVSQGTVEKMDMTDAADSQGAVENIGTWQR